MLAAMDRARAGVRLGALEEALATGMPQLIDQALSGAVDGFEARLTGAAAGDDDTVETVLADTLKAGARAVDLCVPEGD